MIHDLYITGHSRPSNSQLMYLTMALKRCITNDWRVVTGDLPGIDHHVARLCADMEIMCTVWGVGEINHDYSGPCIDRQILRVSSSNMFSERRKLTHWLVDQADRVMVIGDGRKNTTCHHAYQYAAAQEKRAWLLDLSCKVVSEVLPVIE